MTTGVTVSVGDDPALYALPGISNYSVREESTPVDPADSTGAAGIITVNMLEGVKTEIEVKRMYRKTLLLEDRGLGSTRGIVRVPSGSNKQLALTADLRTNLLVAHRTAEPYNGFVTGYLEYLLSLVGITSGYVINDIYDTMPAVFIGWQGEVWLKIKQLMAAIGGEATLASGNIVFRPLRGRQTIDRRDAELSWSVDDSSLALSVEGYWYESTYQVGALAYPKGGWNDNVQVYQVDARETIEFDIPVEASLTSITQPVAQDYVDRYHSSSSVYAVNGSDGLPIPAAQWLATGGKVEVEIGDDTRSLIVRITGADLDRYAPFRIAVAAGPSDTYSSLRIVGTGVFYTKHLQVFNTSVDEELTTTEVGATIDTEFITSSEVLSERMLWTASRFGGPRQTINVRTRGINRSGDSGSYRYPTMADFNAYATAQGWSTVAHFNASAGDPPEDWDLISDFNAWWMAQTEDDDFANQAFGNIAGARRFHAGLWFRIRTNDVTAGGVSYMAENDTTVGDFNAYANEQGWSTIADFNAAWAGASLADFNVAPLTEGA